MLSILFAGLFTYAQPVYQAQPDCKVHTAQFIGQVVLFDSIKSNEENGCIFGILPTTYEAEYICPLDIGEATMARFIDRNCARKNGDPIDGVIYKKDGVIYFDQARFEEVSGKTQ